MLLFNQLQTYLFLALVLFVIGLYGVLARRSLIAILISVELILNAASINFMAFNRFLAPHPAVGQVITLFIMAVAAAEPDSALMSAMTTWPPSAAKAWAMPSPMPLPAPVTITTLS